MYTRELREAAKATRGRPLPAVSLRQAREADGPQVRDLLLRRGHTVLDRHQAVIVATIEEDVVAVAVGSLGSGAALADVAVEAAWIGSGLGAALGRALGEELCSIATA